MSYSFSIYLSSLSPPSISPFFHQLTYEIHITSSSAPPHHFTSPLAPLYIISRTHPHIISRTTSAPTLTSSPAPLHIISCTYPAPPLHPFSHHLYTTPAPTLTSPFRTTSTTSSLHHTCTTSAPTFTSSCIISIHTSNHYTYISPPYTHIITPHTHHSIHNNNTTHCVTITLYSLCLSFSISSPITYLSIYLNRW